jgi:polyphosphate kinase
MMHRNLDRRVEALVKVGSEDVKARVREFLDLALSDNFSAWTLRADGSWVRLTPGENEVIDMQSELTQRATARRA